MTTKTMMQLAWDNWHADIDPSDIPGINPSFQEGWERCAELHTGIDMDEINADLIGYREQIARLREAVERLQYEVDAIPAIKEERDDLSSRYETASRLVTSLSEALAKSLKERDALKAELARPESTTVSLLRAENAALKDAARLALDALYIKKAALAQMSPCAWVECKQECIEWRDAAEDASSEAIAALKAVL